MKLFSFALLTSIFSCNSQETTIKSAVLHVPYDSLQTQPIRVLKILKDSSIRCIEIRGKDTTELDTAHYFKTYFSDLNADGHIDARVSIFSNLPNQCETYFFDSNNNHFRYVENSDLDFTKVIGAELYYSYSRAGCSDMNWESELGRVEDFRWEPIGHILGKGCDAPGEKQEIRVYKSGPSDSTAETLVEVLPYKRNIPVFGAKWDFIKQYWQKNWKAFVN